jgi:hypothetical protein
MLVERQSLSTNPTKHKNCIFKASLLSLVGFAEPEAPQNQSIASALTMPQIALLTRFILSTLI